MKNRRSRFAFFLSMPLALSGSTLSWANPPEKKHDTEFSEDSKNLQEWADRTQKLAELDALVDRWNFLFNSKIESAKKANASRADPQTFKMYGRTRLIEAGAILMNGLREKLDPKTFHGLNDVERRAIDKDLDRAKRKLDFVQEVWRAQDPLSVTYEADLLWACGAEAQKKTRPMREGDVDQLAALIEACETGPNHSILVNAEADTYLTVTKVLPGERKFAHLPEPAPASEEKTPTLAAKDRDSKKDGDGAEIALELDESALSAIQGPKDPPEVDKAAGRRKAAAAFEERKKLLAQARKDLENKAAALAPPRPAEAPHRPIARKTQGGSDEQRKLNAAFRRAVDSGVKDLADGRRSISKEMAGMGKLLALSEVEDLVATPAEKGEERERVAREWDEMIDRYKDFYRSTTGGFEERFSKLMIQVNEDHTRRYDPSASFMSQCLNAGGFCNCVGNTKLSAGVAMAVLSGEGMPENKEILIQDLGYHLAAVVYDTKDKTVWDMLAGGEPTSDLKGKFYHPAHLMNAELRRKGASAPGPIEEPKLLAFSGRLEMNDAERRQLALNGGRKKKNAPRVDDGFLYDEDIKLKDPSGGENKKTEHQYSRPYRKSGAAGAAAIAGGLVEHGEPEVYYDAAISDMRALLSSHAFKDYLSLKRDPTRLASGDYDQAKIAQLQQLQDDIYDILSGSGYVTGSNRSDGYPVLRERLVKEFPELTTLYQTLMEGRAPLSDLGFSDGVDRSKSAQKYFDFFRAIGPRKWALYKALEAPRPSEAYLSEALGHNGVILNPKSPAEQIDSYFVQEDKVGYLAQYRRKTGEQEGPGGGAKDQATPARNAAKRKSAPPESRFVRPEPARVDDSAGGVNPSSAGGAGAGKDPKGIAFQPGQEALTQLDPIQFAQFIEQGNLTGARWLNARWTPSVTAALRGKKEYTKDFVEWFGKTGYRAVADSRPPETRGVAGPDKKPIPKDLAALLVDFIAGKDGTDADKAPLIAEIERNYGSVGKYLEQVKADFSKKPAAPSAPASPKGDNFDVFERLARQRGIDPKILGKADRRSFSYKARAAETATLGPSPGEDAFSHELQRTVQLSKYDIQATPVTQLQWYLVMGRNPSMFSAADGDGDHEEVPDETRRSPAGPSITPFIPINLNHPVERVSWDEVQQYIQRLNGIDGKCRYRLPTGAEWEAAARAKGRTAYFFGNDAGGKDGTILQEYAWFSKNSGNRTHSVSQKKPNGEGLYDMAGNVAQWTQDVGRGPVGRGPRAGVYHRVRGGGWASDPDVLRSARAQLALRANGNIGFRLVRTCP